MRKLKLEELNRLDLEQYKQIEKLPVIVILDNIRSLFNVGAIFRTADAFLVSEIHLCGITAKPPHREIHKTALGATESVSWKYFDKAMLSVKSLKEEGYSIFAIEQTDQSIVLEDWDIDTNDKIAIVFGNEVKGVSEPVLEHVDGCIEIPQFGTKHSLNVSVSAGIVVWTVFSHLKSLLLE